MPKARAVLIDKPGGPEVLKLGHTELPEPNDDQVLVSVRAAGLNRADCLQRMGMYPPPPGVPQNVPGLEFAGEIESVGSNVSSFAPGDRVMGIVGGGAMADRLLTRAEELLPIPNGMSFEDAAAIPEAFVTAYDAAVLQGGLKEGQTLLIHAVASGVGTAAVQLCKAFGANSIGTSRSAEKIERCLSLGLDHGVVVEDKQFADAIRVIVPKGVDVILDTIGAAYLGQNLKVVAKQGRIVCIGLLGGAKAELSLGALLAKRASIIGSVLRSRSAQEKGELNALFAKNVLPHFANASLKPIVDAVLPMEEVADAHATMGANKTSGKLILTWS